MTAPFTPTHVTHFRGRDIPVIVTREYTDHKGRARLHVENEHGTGWIAVPRNVHPLPDTEPAREAEALAVDVFDDWSEAFAYCRAMGHPVTLFITDKSDGDPGKWKLFPSGSAKRLGDLPVIARAEAEADVELRFGLVLLDEGAEAVEVNAALREWRDANGYNTEDQADIDAALYELQPDAAEVY